MSVLFLQDLDGVERDDISNGEYSDGDALYVPAMIDEINGVLTGASSTGGVEKNQESHYLEYKVIGSNNCSHYNKQYFYTGWI